MSQEINGLKSAEGNLFDRAVKGGFWVFLLRIAQLIFQIIKLIIVARILNPSDFGLMGIALLTMAVLETFSKTGFQAALIQKREDIKIYLDSAWTVLVLRGFILFAFLYLIAPYAAIFFKVPQAKLIIQIVGVSILFQAFTNIGIIYFRKELEFNKEFFYQISGTLADFITTISVALMLRNVWALVFGFLAGNFVRFIISYLVHPYKPRIHLSLEKVKELFGFGKWIFGSSILLFLLTQGDDAFVGKFLGITMLGFYQLAYRISNMPATEITHVISQVTFPAYSKFQDNIPKLREAYLKVLQIIAFLSFPIAGLIFALAPDFTKIFLGEKWMPMVPAMQALCIFGLTRSVNATFGPIFQSIGKPKIMTKIAALQLIIMLILIYPFTTKWGILGTSIAVAIPNFIVCIYLSIKLMHTISFKLSSYLKRIFIPIIGTLIMLLMIAIIQWLGKESLSNFLLSVMLGVLLYIGVFILISKKIRSDFEMTVKQVLNIFRART